MTSKIENTSIKPEWLACRMSLRSTTNTESHGKSRNVFVIRLDVFSPSEPLKRLPPFFKEPILRTVTKDEKPLSLSSFDLFEGISRNKTSLDLTVACSVRVVIELRA